MKISKNPKKVKLDFKKVIVETIHVSYKCPACMTTFNHHNSSHFKNVSRFYCDCGQELITEKEEKKIQHETQEINISMTQSVKTL